MPSIGHKLLTALLACALALGQTALAASPSPPDRVSDPILGVPLNWRQLPQFETPILGESERRDRRELARVDAGHHQLVLVLSLIPIHADVDGETAPLGYEVDSGQLIKHFGNFASPLGASSGDLSGDFPELRPELLDELLARHVDTVLAQYPDRASIRHALAKSVLCGGFDASALKALEARTVELPHCIPSGR